MIQTIKLEDAIESVMAVHCILLKLDGSRHIAKGEEEMYSILARLFSDAAEDIREVLEEILREEE